MLFAVMDGGKKRLARWVAAAVGVFAWGVFVSAPLEAQVHEGVELVRAELLADSETIVPGRPVTLGLRLRMAPGWHTYWEYPGDAGMATMLDLDLPDGFRATALQWPVPKFWVQPGDLEGYGYEDEVLLLLRVFPPMELDGDEIEIRGTASWLVCKELCLPGSADLSVRLKVAEGVRPANAELFQRFRERLPRPLREGADEPVRVAWRRQASELLLQIDGPENWKYSLYPLPPAEVVIGHPETASAGNRASIRVPLRNAPKNLAGMEGVLVAETDDGTRRSWRVSAN